MNSWNGQAVTEEVPVRHLETCNKTPAPRRKMGTPANPNKRTRSQQPEAINPKHLVLVFNEEKETWEIFWYGKNGTAAVREFRCASDTHGIVTLVRAEALRSQKH